MPGVVTTEGAPTLKPPLTTCVVTSVVVWYWTLAPGTASQVVLTKFKSIPGVQALAATGPVGGVVTWSQVVTTKLASVPGVHVATGVGPLATGLQVVAIQEGALALTAVQDGTQVVTEAGVTQVVAV